MTFPIRQPPDPCRCGGPCPTCNPAPIVCQSCLIAEVEHVDGLCDACAAASAEEEALDALRACPVCGTPSETRCCSPACSRADAYDGQ